MHGSAQTGILFSESGNAECGPDWLAQTDVRQDGADCNRRAAVCKESITFHILNLPDYSVYSIKYW